ncbi:MAG TPA: glycosyltransferase family 39 protein [Pyrinomonadaceae bacterium]|nr:glycosyltransferase family 39 protein [Pyrinomonadaceae bacterium]
MDEQELQPITDSEPEKTDYLWILCCALITAVASFLRFFWLELKPLHHDEGVNGYFLTTLFRNGEYKYDPANYHGPDLYYLALAFTKAFGLNTLSIRASVAIFGVLTVVLAFFLKKYIGKTGSLFAAFFLALSPGMAYISRYFIHEILFVFFSFAVVLAILFFIEKRKAGVGAIIWTSLLLLVCFLPSALNLANVLGGENATFLWILRAVFFLIEAGLVFFVMRVLLSWNEGQPIYLILASASAVLLFATKETAFITLGTMAIACVCVWVWRRINAAEGFAKNKLGLFMAFNLIVLLMSAIEYKLIKQGLKTLYENFSAVAADDPAQMFVFYAILALVAIAGIAWLTFFFVNRNQVETEISEDAGLTWTHFREKLKASETWEFVMVKSALGGAVIALVWLFVRYAIDLLIAWKADKALSSALDKIILSKVDFWILAAAFFCLGLAAIIWLRKKPQKISTDLVLMLAVMIVVFLYVGALFFSSFFTYPEGLQKAFEAYAIWTKTGKTDHTQNGNWAYVRWGMIIEAPILILSALGLLIAMFKARHRFAMFTGLWAFGLFAAYTLIPYKTPWLALSFLLPMCIVAGYAVNELIASKNIAVKALGGISAILATCILAFQTYDINFVRYDSDRMPYVYAHTRREFLDLVKQIEYYADKSGQGKQAKIEIVSPDYWSMPWYMNDYPNAIFEGKPVDANSAEMIVAKKDEQDAEIVTRYAIRYKYIGTYPLRPGVDLVLLVRKDLADSDAQDIYSVFGEPMTITPDDLPEEIAPTETPKK